MASWFCFCSFCLVCVSHSPKAGEQHGSILRVGACAGVTARRGGLLPRRGPTWEVYGSFAAAGPKKLRGRTWSLVCQKNFEVFYCEQSPKMVCQLLATRQASSLLRQERLPFPGVAPAAMNAAESPTSAQKMRQEFKDWRKLRARHRATLFSKFPQRVQGMVDFRPPGARGRGGDHRACDGRAREDRSQVRALSSQSRRQAANPALLRRLTTDGS